MELSCHCRKVIIEVPKPSTVTQCNCSMCCRYMSLCDHYTIDEPKVLIGSFGMASYSWGDQELDFIRCGNCGGVTHYKSGRHDPEIAVNFCLSRKEIYDVPIKYFDGANKL